MKVLSNWSLLLALVWGPNGATRQHGFMATWLILSSDMSVEKMSWAFSRSALEDLRK